jgi:chromosome segregation ATPase
VMPIQQPKVSSVAQRAELASVLAELQQHKETSTQLKLKHDATASRVKYLETELKNIKQKLTLCLQKSSNDDQLIEALHLQIKKIKVLRNHIRTPKIQETTHCLKT